MSRTGRPRSPIPKRHVGAAVPTTLADQATRICDALGVSLSEVLRNGLEEFVATHPTEKLPQPQEDLLSA